MQREYIKYYSNQAGGNINEIGPLLQSHQTLQRGRGLGSLFASLFRFLKPAVASGLNLLKDEAIRTGTNIFSDIASGANLKEAFQDQAKAGIKNLRTSAVNQLHSMYGSGRKRKRKSIKRRVKPKIKSIAKRRRTQIKNKKTKKTRILDIFN